MTPRGARCSRRGATRPGSTMGVDQMGTMFMRREGTDPEP